MACRDAEMLSATLGRTTPMRHTCWSSRDFELRLSEDSLLKGKIFASCTWNCTGSGNPYLATALHTAIHLHKQLQKVMAECWSSQRP